MESTVEMLLEVAAKVGNRVVLSFPFVISSVQLDTDMIRAHIWEASICIKMSHSHDAELIIEKRTFPGRVLL